MNLIVKRNRRPRSQSLTGTSRARLLSRAGFILVIVLVVVAVLALSAYTFSELMLSHHQAAQLSGLQLQARSMVDSGADSVRVFLIQDKATRETAGGLFDNPDQFRGVVVMPSDEPRDRGTFTVLAPKLDDDGNPGGVRYGLEDESTRLNLNSLTFLDSQPSVDSLQAGAQALGALGGTAGTSGSGTTGGAGAATGSSGLGSLAGALGSAASGSSGGSTGGQSGGSGNGRKLLMALPGMTAEIADAILDWLDEDDDPRESGCEGEYYSGLNPPYAPKNGPCETVEELLLVRGVTPQLLFGRDVNRNGMIDQHEEQLPVPEGDQSGSLDRGWSAYLTLFSQERNVNTQGQPRIFVNQQDLQLLSTELSAVFGKEWVNFIILLRQNGPAQQQAATVGGSGARPPMSAAEVQMDLNKPAQYQLTQVLDLIDAQVSVAQSGGSPTTIKSPFTSELGASGIYLPALMDNLSVNQSKTIPGRININQASRMILEGVPGMTPEIVNEIISRRDLEISKGNPNRNHETWLLAEGIATLTEMKILTPFLCGGGDVYRAQIVGYFQDGAAASRAEVVFDATKAAPRLLLWRDMSHLGRGYALETLGVDLSGP